jgi:hypothetical protein
MSAPSGKPTSPTTGTGRQEDASDAHAAPPGTARSAKRNGATIWTESEDAVLRQEYPHHGPNGALAKLPGRDRDEIVARALELGVHERHRPWKPGEIECLRVVFPKGGPDAVQQKLPHRSIEAIRHKAHDLGIQHDRRSATTIEICEIRTALVIAAGNVASAARSLACDSASLRRVATTHGLIPPKDPKPHWKVTEVETLRTWYPKGGAPAVQEKLPHRSVHAIYGMAARLGLAGDTTE